ncbi:MAG: hypothetical protein ACYC1P_10880 [Gaiellaceae bacterium]
MSYWLKMIGADDFQLEERPFDDREELERQVRFPPKRVPRELAVGDELIYYAVGYLRIFGHARLTGTVVENVHHSDPEVRRRWPDAASIQLGTNIRDLRDAPELRPIAPDLLAQIHKGTTILPMGKAEFDRCTAALRKAAVSQDLSDRRQERART